MIYLTTGSPGSAKTLNTIEIVHKLSIKDSRPVYYSNITDVTFDNWINLENPTNWNNILPDGAIYFCDEFYTHFTPKSPTANRESFYTDLATHRHRGIDIFFVCQGMAQIDSFIKTLVYEHKHYKRNPITLPFFPKSSLCFKSTDVMPNPSTKTGRRDAEKRKVKDNKNYYGTYKSTVLDTSALSIPKALYTLLIVVILLSSLSYYMYSFYKEKTDYLPPQIQVEDKINSSTQPGYLPELNSKNSNESFSEQRKKIVFNPLTAYKEEVEGLAYSAKAYWKLQKPVDFPRPVCIINEIHETCKCYTQQSTLMKDYPKVLCIDHVRNGKFDPTKPRRRARDSDARKSSSSR